MNMQFRTIDAAENAAATGRPVSTPVAVAHGNGIGPEIMSASLAVLKAAGADFEIVPIEVGERVYRSGVTSGITDDAWDELRRCKVFYKAPISTPQGGGFKSLNVTIRKSLGLYANVRPCLSYAPFVETKHPHMDLVIIRENEEDLYAGIEHRQTDDVYQCLKLITRPGCERIARYAFEYARAHGRKRVSCFTKDNIMKMTDGLFHKVFDEIAREYPEIATDHHIIDIGAARLADTPEAFDVIVLPNLYGDVVSDIAAQISGSVGLAPSANIGDHGAMFEAIHGSAPDIAGKDLANPSGLLLAGAMMLDHIGQSDVALTVKNAWLKTIEDGIHTPDIYSKDRSRLSLGTRDFANAVIDRLGEEPSRLNKATASRDTTPIRVTPPVVKLPAKKELVGIDVFVHTRRPVDALAALLQEAAEEPFTLTMITNRGVKVWPNGLPETFCTDHWRCRFLARSSPTLSNNEVLSLLSALSNAHVDFIKTEHLFNFDGEPGYSLGQGQ